MVSSRAIQKPSDGHKELRGYVRLRKFDWA